MNYFKKSQNPLFLFFFIFFLILGCSDDEHVDFSDDIFMSATIDGTEYNMNGETAFLSAKRIIEPNGLLKLQVEVVSTDGELVRFVIPKYSGKRMYVIGDNHMLPNIIEYEKVSPYGKWFCNNPGPNELDKNYVEILNDDGKFIEGEFNFSGLNIADNSIRKVSNGKFKLISD